MMKWTHTEPVTKKDVGHLVKALGLGAMICDFGDVDYSCGRGVGSDNDRCLWTTKGHRIEVFIQNGGIFGASMSKEPDLNKPKKVGDKNKELESVGTQLELPLKAVKKKKKVKLKK